MRLLLDTHTFLWLVEGSPQLSLTARRALEDKNNETWLSAASVWEMAIKISTGKLTLAQPLPTYIEEQTSQNGIQILPISLTPHAHSKLAVSSPGSL
jgi:PIN domain nuclease of toxin-antitoxin system